MEKKKKNSNLLIQGKNNNDLKLFFKYFSNPKNTICNKSYSIITVSTFDY